VPDDPRLDSLLDRYQDRLENGRAPDLDDLCRDSPDLRADLEKRITRLHKVGKLLGDSLLPPTNPVVVEHELSLSDDKTWVNQGGGGYSPPVEIPAPPGYEVLAPLGEGGMGVVYKARQVGLNRLVALKMILAGTRARAVDLQRFRNEAQAIATLRHPNIVQVFETGEFRDQPFFSLEFCAGGTLAKAVNGEPQQPVAAAGMAEVLARAVHYAHSRGIVHRDLKPGNVLLSAEPATPSHAPSTLQADPTSAAVAQAALRPPYVALKITDFGLAKRVDDDSGRTQDGSVMGTPAYMAPEQAFGATKDISPATDIHALGAILYELLTGRPPFKGSTVHDTLEQVRHRDPVPVRTLQPHVPPDLETICLKCLQKDPKKRYASALALAEDLRRFLDRRPIHARPVGQIARAWRWAKREPRTAALVGAIGVLFILVPALLVGYSTRLSTTEELLDQHRLRVVAALKAEKAASEAGENNKYLAALSEAGRLRSERGPGWTWTARERVEAAAGTLAPTRDRGALRSELAAAVAAIDLRPVGTVAVGLYAGAVAFAPDGRLAVAPLLVYPVVEYRYVLLFDPQTKTEKQLPFSVKFPKGGTLPDKVTGLAFSPDGKWLFLGFRNGGVLRWRLDGNNKAEPFEWHAHDGEVAGFTFSPDSKWLFTGGHDGRVRRWPIDGKGNEYKSWPPKDGHSEKVTGTAFWSGPRTGILALGADRCRLIDPDTMTEIAAGKVDGEDWFAPAVRGSYGRVAIDPANGTIVVSRGTKVDVSYWERQILQTVATLADPSLEDQMAHSANIAELSLHPSGMLLATVSADEGVAKVWHLGRMELAVAVPAIASGAISFSPDGSMLAVAGDHVTTLYEVGGLNEHTFIGRRGFPVRAMGLTHDGQLATIAGRQFATIAGHPDHGSAVASVWDDSGKLIQTVIHRSDKKIGTGQYRIASNRESGWTAFHAGDDSVTWCTRSGSPPITLDIGVKSQSSFDMAIEDDGRCWIVDSGNRLTVRPAGAVDKPRFVPVSVPWAGRQDLACVRAGGSHIIVGCENGFLRVLGLDGKLEHSLPCFPDPAAMLFNESANTVHATALTEDGTRAIAGTEDGRLWLFRLPGEPIANWEAHRDRVTTVAFDRTGEWLASGSRDRLVRLWRRKGENYQLYMTLQVPDGNPVRQVVFSADGKRLYGLREKETAVRIWHLDKLRAHFEELGLEP